ncbi:hypothetical protein RDABS01_015557 [Bienertia sinuspersici]
MKKLSEMENALVKLVDRLTEPMLLCEGLRRRMQSLGRRWRLPSLRAAESAASCQEVSKREKKTLVKFQSWEKQKSIFQEELTTEKRKLSQLRQELEQAKDLLNQLEVASEVRQFYPGQVVS